MHQGHAHSPSLPHISLNPNNFSHVNDESPRSIVKPTLDTVDLTNQVDDLLSPPCDDQHHNTTERPYPHASNQPPSENFHHMISLPVIPHQHSQVMNTQQLTNHPLLEPPSHQHHILTHIQLSHQ